jgi:trans-aconitate methyltransferase
LPQGIHSIGTRDRLRQTFDRIAQTYDENRPSYPAEIFDDVVAISGLTASSRVLEIGCGTGHATEVFASRGLEIHGIDLGENMAAIGRQRLAHFPRVTIEVTNFENWTTTARYELIYAATAFHWLDPATRQQKIASLLRPGGWLAVWRNRHIRNGSSDNFLDAAQTIYSSVAPELALERGQLPGPDEIVALEKEEFDPTLFEEPVRRVHYWSRPYTATGYVELLNTHSDHQLLPADRRQQLFDQLSTLIDTDYGGSVIKDYATVLQMVRLRN